MFNLQSSIAKLRFALGSGEAAKKGGTSLCLLNTSQWARLPIKEYFIKLFDKIASRDAYIKQPLPTSPIGEEFNQFEKSYSFLIINYSLAKLASRFSPPAIAFPRLSPNSDRWFPFWEGASAKPRIIS